METYYFSTYMANKVIDAVLNGTSFTPPTSLYLALFTSNPSFDGSGDEVSGGSYARQAITFGTAANREASQGLDITFTLPDAVVTHFAIYDAVTSGNLLVFGSFSTSYIAGSGDTLTISNLTVGLSEG